MSMVFVHVYSYTEPIIKLHTATHLNIQVFYFVFVRYVSLNTLAGFIWQVVFPQASTGKYALDRTAAQAVLSWRLAVT